jgi:hypothetical protein
MLSPVCFGISLKFRFFLFVGFKLPVSFFGLIIMFFPVCSFGFSLYCFSSVPVFSNVTFRFVLYFDDKVYFSSFRSIILRVLSSVIVEYSYSLASGML